MKTKSNIASSLSASQQAVLQAAAKHVQGLAIEFPQALKGGARSKVLEALAKSGLLTPSKGGGEYRITQAGYAAIGIEPLRRKSLSRETPDRADAKASSNAPRVRENSKQAQVVELLKRKQGATIEQISQATNWQVHTVRGFIAGALKKRLGLLVTSDKPEGQARVYRVQAATATT